MGVVPHAEEILAFYVGLLEIQAEVAHGAPVVRWLDLTRLGDPRQSAPMSKEDYRRPRWRFSKR